MHALQIVTLLMSAASSRSQNFDINGRSKCCSDSLSPLVRQQSWIDILRQATYQSIIRHLDYTGTLDGRLDRDHALWKRLQQARYVDDHLYAITDIITGVLIERPDTKEIDFEFHQKDKSIFDCSRNRCSSMNNSVMAIWRVRTIDDPYELWITVKVPNVRDGMVEDVYKYSVKFGLQKLNPDPLQLKSTKSENDHRFYIASKTKSDRKLMPRMDFLFPSQSKSNIFGEGRVAPSPFAYDSPMLSGRSADGWMFSARKPHPGVVVDTGLRSHHQAPLFNPLSGPYIALGPQGYRHIIYSLPSIAPPQNLDSQDIRGFLPSVGPINVPPPFKTELPSPPYSHYYNEPPKRYITPPSKHFNPSKEFVRYSELDPLYHSEGEPELLHTSPIPDRNLLKSTITFPSLVNNVLQTNSPIIPTKLPMQIIVKDLDQTTKMPQTTREDSKMQNNKTRISTKTTSKSHTAIAAEKTLTKVFGEKIKSKNITTVKPRLRTGGKLKYTTKAITLTTQNRLNNNTVTYNNEYDNLVTTLPTDVLNRSYTTIVTNKDKRLNKNTTPTISKGNNENTEPTEPIDVFTEFTTEDVKKQTTYLDFKTTTESNEYEDNTPIIETEAPTKEKKVVETSRKTKKTMVVGIPTHSTESPTYQTEKVSYSNNSSDLYDDYYTDETTDTPVDSTTVETYDPETTAKSTETDFFPTLTDALFAIETTTQTTNKTTTITPKTKSNPENEDAETQESQQQRIQYRLLTFPGDSVSIVANRMSKSVSYRTAGGKEKKLQHKLPNSSVDGYTLTDYYKDYSTIL